MVLKVGQIGYGFVGSALAKSFSNKGCETIVYDKYKMIGKFDDVLSSDILFLCLPTPFVEGHGFDLTQLMFSCKKLEESNYNGLIVIKSTVEPGVTNRLGKMFVNLKLCHNPEFLTARTAFEDFHNQSHIVIGYATDGINTKYEIEVLKDLYHNLYPDADISICTSVESESMKLFCNNFYAIKVQVFNEFYLLCQKIGADFESVKGMMLKNGWVADQHHNVPGPDGQLSYGGLCFTKDTKSLVKFMADNGSMNGVLKACIIERDKMRKD